MKKKLGLLAGSLALLLCGVVGATLYQKRAEEVAQERGLYHERFAVMTPTERGRMLAKWFWADWGMLADCGGWRPGDGILSPAATEEGRHGRAE